MPQPEYLDPYSFLAQGEGDMGALLIHGYTGSVAETRPMAEYLAARGLTVHCPLLPGHGGEPDDLIRVSWRAWEQEVNQAYQKLADDCRIVFVGGLSLGSLLALRLGFLYPQIAGLIVMAPALQLGSRLLPLALVLRHVMKYEPQGPGGDSDLQAPQAMTRVWSYDRTPLWGGGELYLLQRQVRRNLAHIRQPVLIFQGEHDARLDRRSAQVVCDGLASRDKTLVWLEHSGHNILVDGERETVWSQSYRWMMERVPPEQG